MPLELFGTSGCHLCEMAEVTVQQAFQQRGAALEVILVEIADDGKLMETYGLRIPVLKNGNAEIDWPFTADDLLAFFKAHSPAAIQHIQQEIPS